jgi:hypothetical protein
MVGFAAVLGLQSLAVAQASTPTFDQSYVVTTRTQPGADDVLDVLADGKLFYCKAAGHYVQAADDYVLADGTACTSDPMDEASSSAAPPPGFMTALEADVRRTAMGSKDAHLTIYVHGLGVPFPAAVAEAAQFGLHLQGQNISNDQAGTTDCVPSATDGSLPKDCILCPQDARRGLYPGLLIAFDWPSFPLFGPPQFEALLLEQMLAPVTAKEIRTRADDSAAAFANIVEFIVEGLRQRLRADGIRLRSTLIAHSEGNYMVLTGAQAAAERKLRKSFDDVLLLAADISSAALNRGQPGRDLDVVGRRVTAYHSASDPDLMVSSYLWSSLHDPAFAARLGQVGPYSKTYGIVGVDATQATNRIQPDIGSLSVEDFDDCAVPSPLESLKSPVLAGLLAQHGSYRCVAEILDDMNMTMLRGIETIPGADRRIRVPGNLRHFALQTDNDPPLFSCEDWIKAGFGNPSQP